MGVIAGEQRSERWSSSGKPRPLDYYEARGVLQNALSPFQLPIDDQPNGGDGAEPGLLHPGRCAQLLLEGRPAGWFAQLHPGQSEALDLPDATYLFQLALPPLLAAATRRNRLQPSFRAYATVPASERDLALIVPEEITASALLQAIRKAGKPLLENAELVDRYSGSQVEAGFTSQAFRLRYRDERRTLTDAEVEASHSKVRASLENQFKARLRS